jgi:CubicO group peptidase (beta-lactamase class C family)
LLRAPQAGLLLKARIAENLFMRVRKINHTIIAGVCLCLWLQIFSAVSPCKELVRVLPETVGLNAVRLKHIDETVKAAIKAGELPGAVVLVARHGSIAYINAFGNRAVAPNPEPMTTDTIFDMSSLTKVMATTPSIMRLVEDGVLRLDDKVKRYLPEFTGDGKDGITLSQLLSHYSGLRPDFDLSKEWFGYKEALSELWKEKVVSAPGKEFAYSDLNFIALGEIVRVVSGKALDAFVQEEIFAPLGMVETSFRPSADRIARIAPTETRRNTLKYLKGQASNPDIDQMLRGEVHDPTAWRMGGVAGHAGLFSSARDVAIYAQALLKNGKYAGGRLLSAASVRAMTSPQSPIAASQVRGLGWDLKSSYSSPRGDLLPGGYGHTGFSGTSLWVYPSVDAFIVILSNRVHPDGGKDINHLRGTIANIVASAITDYQ